MSNKRYFSALQLMKPINHDNREWNSYPIGTVVGTEIKKYKCFEKTVDGWVAILFDFDGDVNAEIKVDRPIKPFSKVFLPLPSVSDKRRYIYEYIAEELLKENWELLNGGKKASSKLSQEQIKEILSEENINKFIGEAERYCSSLSDFEIEKAKSLPNVARKYINLNKF